MDVHLTLGSCKCYTNSCDSDYQKPGMWNGHASISFTAITRHKNTDSPQKWLQWTDFIFQQC